MQTLNQPFDSRIVEWHMLRACMRKSHPISILARILPNPLVSHFLLDFLKASTFMPSQSLLLWIEHTLAWLCRGATCTCVQHTGKRIQREGYGNPPMSQPRVATWPGERSLTKTYPKSAYIFFHNIVVTVRFEFRSSVWSG